MRIAEIMRNMRQILARNIEPIGPFHIADRQYHPRGAVVARASQWRGFQLEAVGSAGERCYRLDRLLTQLKSAGKFDGVKAVVFGDFSECFELDKKQRWPELLKRHFAKAKFPVIYGVRAGHADDLQMPILMGYKVKVATKGKPTLEFLETWGG